MKIGKSGTLLEQMKGIVQRKKSALVIILLCVLICAGMVYAFLLSPQDDTGELPLENLTAADIAAAEVQLTPPGESYALTDAEIETLAQLLQGVVIHNRSLLTEPKVGQSVQFTLTLSHGGTKTICPDGNTITINGITYAADYDPCQALSSFANYAVASTPAENAESFLTMLYTTNYNGRYESLLFEQDELGEEAALENYSDHYDIITTEVRDALLETSIPLNYDTRYAGNPLHVTGVTLTGDTPGGADEQFQFTVTAADSAGTTTVSFNGTITVDPKTGLISAFAQAR